MLWLAAKTASGIALSDSEVRFVASVTSVDPAATGKSCLGTLVHERLVVTTANCLVTGSLSWFDPRRMSVSLGAHTYGVSRAIMPNEYVGATHRHNIGLLVLAAAVPARVAAPAEVLAGSPPPGAPVYAIGHSAADSSNATRPASVPPTQAAQLVVLPSGSCGAYSHYDPETQLCALAAEGTGLCAGDEGAPLVVAGAAGGYALAGVVSYSARVGPAPAAACGAQIVYFERPQVWAGWISKAVRATFSDISVSLDVVSRGMGALDDDSALPTPADGLIAGPLSQRTSAAPCGSRWLLAAAAAAAVAALVS
ncbi:hypothetical protein IWQ57_004436 [Coemansia nantahalensis]|uniref:Uncharacterized protein n=1 Tax=Coemansia nantahalensis TaxID=2789366 RepID=A0ACC1JS75_9FUNG|nr:hypothetical protein IWQ57_004436 [Coemansia nantahalensis]